MDLVGAWVRQLLGAGMAAAIVPVAILAALAVVLVGAGGFGGLGSLGQLIGGPQISPAEEAAARESQSDDLARVAPPTIVASRTPTARRPRTSAPRRQRPRPQAPPPRAQGRIPPVARPPVAVAPPPAPPPPPAPDTPPAPAAPPTPSDSANPLTDVLAKTVEDVQTVVGEVIDRLGRAVERLLGPPPRGR